MSYYLYTNGVLKRVDIEPPTKPIEKNYWQPVKGRDGVENDIFHGAEFNSDTYNYESNLEIYNDHVKSLPSIQVSDELKKVWSEGHRYEEGKDFVIKNIDPIGMENDKAGKPTAIPVNTLQEEKERAFTLKEALEIWQAAEFYGETKHNDNLLTNILSPDKYRYFKQTFNIDLPKQQ